MLIEMKRRLSVLIDSKLLQQFKEEVLARHGKLYARMGQSVEEALREWIKRK
jgi:hypothetical protein